MGVKRYLGARMGILIALLVAVVGFAQLVSANHALSEVWSEADGLQLKYTTDHDDLLSTKGSELSLASQQRNEAAPQQAAGSSAATESDSESDTPQQAQEEAQADKGADRAPTQTEEAGAGDTGEQANAPESANSEEGTDSSQRETDKVPIGSRAKVERQSKFSEPAARFRSAARQDRERSARLSSTPDAMRFNSAMEMADNMAGNEMASADPGAESNNQQESGQGMRPLNRAESANSIEDNDDDDDDGEQRQGPTLRAEPGPDVTNRVARPRGRQGSVEFERQAAGSANAKQMEPKSDEQETSSNVQIPDPVESGEPSGEQTGSVSDKTNAEEEPAEQAKESQKGNSEQSESDESSQSGEEDVAASGPLKGTKQQQQQQLQQSPRGSAARPLPASNVDQESPDSVRDDFISPGHYPGSMAHLTQAASEQKQVTSDEQQAASQALPASTVTPEPEAQPESQQIMAPLLQSTTTMAPMVATQPQQNSTGSGSGATSTAAPTLKRFKFRKYR